MVWKVEPVSSIASLDEGIPPQHFSPIEGAARLRACRAIRLSQPACDLKTIRMDPASNDGPKGDQDPLILVIDDDPGVREGLRALFESVNLQVKTFGSAEEFLRSEVPDQVSCLVLDVRLPGLSGLEFQREVQVDIPIIFITGHGDIPMSVQAMKAGAVEFLTKPFRDQDLLDAVRVAIDRDRKQRERRKTTRDLRIRFDALTPREREVLSLVASGMMNRQAATEIGISEVTVKVYRRNLMAKLGARSLAELVSMADSLGLPHNTRANGPAEADLKTALRMLGRTAGAVRADQS
jgi:FixJ family two-component response regulator